MSNGKGLQATATLLVGLTTGVVIARLFDVLGAEGAVGLGVLSGVVSAFGFYVLSRR
jgi:hypothetical protein